MKQIIVMVVLIALVPLTQQVYAISGYDSGFNHGVQDAHDTCLHPDGCHWYILESGKGFKFHTFEFVKGYVDGFCRVAGPHMSSDADQAAWNCRVGPDSASWVD